MKKRPHIVIVSADEWRGDVLGHMGNPAAVTPNLDRMVATDAVSFRNAFCQNPVCAPSRCSFMTGWYPHVNGHRTMYHMLRSGEGEPVLLKILKAAGYFVWWGGKNDLVPAQHGFGEYCDVKYASPDLPDRKSSIESTGAWRGKPGSDTYYSLFGGRLRQSEGKAYCHDSDWANVLGAVEFIHKYHDDKPLCMYLSLENPHPPYAVEEPWYSMIDRGKLPPRISTPEEWRGKPAMLRGIWERQNLGGWTEDRWRELRAVYYGMCSRVDHQLGMVVEALDDAGIYDETAIFMLSDHGDFAGDYGLVEKTQNTFEDCLIRVPLVVKPPAAFEADARVTDALVELVDFPATVYEVAGIEPGYTCFGRSLVPAIKGDQNSHRDAVFCEGGRLFGERQAMELESAGDQAPEGLYWPRVGLQSRDDGPYHGKATMCRTATLKYVHRLYEDDELYDLEKDPGELHNVLEDRRYARSLARLKGTMLAWYQETCDVVPFDTDGR